MGMDPFNFADALLGILAQRLAKRLCKCKEAYTPDQAEIKHFINEYCERAASTRPTWKTDPTASCKKVFERLDQGLRLRQGAELHALQADGLRHLRRHAATRAASACTSC